MYKILLVFTLFSVTCFSIPNINLIDKFKTDIIEEKIAENISGDEKKNYNYFYDHKIEEKRSIWHGKNGRIKQILNTDNKEINVFGYGINGNITLVGRIFNKKRDGNWFYYNNLGEMINKISYKNGLLDGIAEAFYPSGKLHIKKVYKMGKRVGKIQLFDQNGQLKKKVNSENLISYEK